MWHFAPARFRAGLYFPAYPRLHIPVKQSYRRWKRSLHGLLLISIISCDAVGVWEKGIKNIFINIIMMNSLMLLPPEYFHYPPTLHLRREQKPNCVPQLFHGIMRQPAIRWCYKRRFATTIFNATHYSNIAATLFRMGATLFQHCNAVLH